MVALLIVLIGFALIFGQKDFAQSLVRPIIGLILILSFAPGLLRSCGSAENVPPADHGYLALVAVALLGVLLFAGWLRFVRHRRALDAWRAKDRRPPSLKRRVDDDE